MAQQQQPAAHSPSLTCVHISEDWYRVDSEYGAFYGYTPQQAQEKALADIERRRARDAAQDYRSNIRPANAHHGYVIVNCFGTVAGWVESLSHPQHWEPHCRAVDVHGSQWLATGGNEYDGAEEWTPTHDAFGHIPEALREFARAEQAEAIRRAADQRGSHTC